ncbi:VOC family protein [Dactylosporangium sucinum]|uniref:VOC domain-containing protein n=1 Tax=Dactylosporangium sucinum TaxID=1424081 RepID=A0A917TZC8_9ACTN|nr:hypothetical protein [Dactylosporangium sucinum]GGM45836.1 hypothetical protein GCM10007977_054450 [Dactylosporangium sucinum]
MTTLGPPDHGIVGCTDIEAATTFFGALGFRTARTGPLPAGLGAQLYGLAGPAEQRWLSVPGARHGGVRLVATPRGSSRMSTLEPGGYAVDVYSRDIEHSREALTAAGLPCTEIVRWQLGGADFAQLRVDGPDGIRAIVVEGPRRASALDHDEHRLHSEAQSFVFVVTDIDADKAFWRAAGLEPLYHSNFPLPAGFGGLLDLPDDIDSMQLGLHWCATCPDGPARIEMLGLPTGSQTRAAPPAGCRLPQGMAAVGFAVPDVPAAANLLAANGATVELTTVAEHPAVAHGRSPAGVAFELWPAQLAGAAFAGASEAP